MPLGDPIDEPWDLADSRWDPDRYSPESKDHPAKFNLPMLNRILDLYLEPEMNVLDPMCGIGTTIVESMDRGNNAFGVELDPRFAQLARGNALMAMARNPDVRCGIVQGDGGELYPGIKMDLVVMSPPYSRSLKGGIGPNAYRMYRSLDGEVSRDDYRSTENAWQRDTDQNMSTYSRDPMNIGNMGTQDYCDGMVRIYRRCRDVLSHDGVMVVVVKNYIRNWKVVHLDLLTKGLVGTVGFRYVGHHVRSITRPSPGRRMSMAQWSKKKPDVPYPVTTEEILVFRVMPRGSG